MSHFLGWAATLRLATGLLLATVVTGLAQVPASPVPASEPLTFSPADLFALQHASDVQISPDGQHLAYVRVAIDRQTDASQPSIWLLEVATGQQRLLVAAASSPRWSPDGQRLAYLAGAADGTTQLFVRELAANTGVRISQLPEAPGRPVWSPDGQTLAFTLFVAAAPDTTLLGPALPKPAGASWAAPLQLITAVHYRLDGGGSPRPGYTHLFVLPAAGGVPRQLTFGPYNEGQAPSWTPDGRALLFSANHGPQWERDPYSNTDVFEVQLATGAVRQLTHRLGPDQEPVASPNGQLIAYTGYDERQRGLENVNLYVMNRDGSNPRVLSTTLDRLVSSPHWAADGRSVYVAYGEAGVGQVARFTLDGQFRVVAAGVEDDFSLAKTGVLAFELSGPDYPAEVAVQPLKGPVRRLTRLNAALLDPKTLAQVRPLAVRSSFDGLAVGAWLVTPPHYDPARRYPTILVIHGGPYGSYGPQWSADFQLYAAAGYVVVYANPRGSTSYGSAYFSFINHDFPSHDADDLLSVVDAAVAQGVADPARLFVTGGSAGGELTAWLTGKTTRFRAAVAQKPVINAVSDALLSDQYIGSGPFLFGARPWEAPQAYWAHSPLSLVGQVQTPTLLLVGEQDSRTPPSEAEQYYAALQARGIPTALVLVPGAGHEGLAARPSQHIAEVAVTLAWFARYGGH